jgi:hypothetical protein
MILTAEMTEVQARTAVDHYLATGLGPAYKAGRAQLRDDGRWSFVVLCQREDMWRTPAVGFIYLDARTGQVEALSDDRLREMCEAGAVQAAQARNELARDEDGYILRQHARIKANVWISDRVGLKVRAAGGTFVPLEPPVWRFSIWYHTFGPLTVIDVDAKTGEIEPLTALQLQAIREDVRALKRLQTLAAAA